MLKRCTSCGREKPEGEFRKNAKCRDGLSSWCAECHREKTRAWREAGGRRRALYGITNSEYETLVESQGGGCAICESAGKLFVDHDHGSGAVRGLLCPTCNTGLGALRDKAALLRRAADYLDHPPAESTFDYPIRRVREPQLRLVDEAA